MEMQKRKNILMRYFFYNLCNKKYRRNDKCMKYYKKYIYIIIILVRKIILYIYLISL